MNGDDEQFVMDEASSGLPEDMPFVDVAAYLFLEDIADKQGPAGLNNYLVGLANSLARSMPSEEYDTWEEFADTLIAGKSILSTFENVTMPTPNCVVTGICPFDRGWREYVKRVGTFNPIHIQVAEYYNQVVKPGAINSLCVIHQVFRNAATERIKVGGKPLRYAQVAAIWSDGSRRVAPDEWLPLLLEKAGISSTKLNMMMRRNACVWVLYSE